MATFTSHASYLASLILLAASPAFAAPDPTVAADAMADALRQRLTEADDMRLHALIVGPAGEGVALVGPNAERATAVRRGSRLAQTVDGLKVDVSIKAVTPLGVELATSGGRAGVFLPGSFTPLAAPTNPPPEFLSYLESEKVPIGGLMRLVSDQAGVNISVSDAASKKTVSIFLRNVTADAAVEEICRATGLWFRREPNGSVIRIMTMDEYSDNLNTFREESTEMFTLLYPNVIEVASVIYGLYPDRTLISLGEEEFDEDDEYDLSRRFRRFRVLDDNGGSQFISLEAPQTTSTGSRSGSGNFSFSRGGATSRLTQWDQLRQRNRQRNRLGGDQVPLGADDARLMEGAYRNGNTNLLDSVRAQATSATANIFVSLSRKNNMLVVRTSDVRVMDEIRGLVKKLDVPTPMVLMEVKVLEIDVDDKYNATVKGENSHFSLFAQKGSDFPNLPELRGDKNFTVFSDVLRRTIGKVIHSVAEIDSRPMLCGAYFRVQENRLEVVSCDSFTLSKCSIACEIHDVGSVKAVGTAFNIPGHALNEMVRLLPDKKVDVSVQIARKHAIFILGDMLFFTRLIDGEYIDYQRIIPKDNPIRVKVERDRLLGALERSNLVAEEKIVGAVRSYVKIILDGDEMTVTSSSVNGRVKDDIVCDHEGEDLEIAFNCKYLLNCVRAADADGLILTLKSPTQSITMEPQVKNPDDDFFYLVQPVRMHE